MSLWLLMPRDPLIFRDGKPFSAIPGERSKSMLFPYPSTLAGAVRTRAGTDLVSGQFDKNHIQELKRVAVRGPVLVELDNNDQFKAWFCPAPADALLVMKNSVPTRYSLAPLKIPKDAHSDLDGKTLVGPLENIKDKPLSHPPHYWKWEQMQAWLEKPVDGQITLNELGIQGPERETRTHVSIDPGTQAALPGALFQTSGMEFTHVVLNDEKRMKDAHSLAIAFETDADLEAGVDFLGGERRVVHWHKTQKVFPESQCPDSIKKKIMADKHCRLILATPAHFTKGHLPERLENDFRVKVQAVALSRYQTISGWDYAKPRGGEPKPTRRLVPAGSVYFLNLEGVKDIEMFVNATWLQAISDDDQSRLDGFGLALLGTWDGVLRTMEVKS